VGGCVGQSGTEANFLSEHVGVSVPIVMLSIRGWYSGPYYKGIRSHYTKKYECKLESGAV
jgi:hypothetical protein